MKTVNMEKVQVSGISIRTNNKNEMDMSTSKISGLWNNFFDSVLEEIEDKKDKPFTYGVYSHYESDYTGDFTVTAGIDVNTEASKSITLEGGKYLVFENTGAMPSVVIDTWGEIWKYFDSNPEVKRSYNTDYEKYISQDTIEIYIGIE